jgi:LacI family transcriptional regulator
MSLKKIAEELGLSLTTVSRALNDYPEVALSTRQAVRAAAVRMDYRPDMRARGLALGKADAVALVFPITPGDLGDRQFLAVASSMSEVFAQAGIDLLIVSASPKDELAAYERSIAGRRVDAFVVPRTLKQDPRLALLQSRNIPFVAYGRSDTLSPTDAWLDFDNEAGCALATQRLLDLGHRAFGYLGAPPEYNFAAQRYAGFCRALGQAELTIAEPAVQRSALDRRSGYAAMQTLLALENRPTAVIMDNNLAGVGAVRAILDAGLRLGHDISVIVYDGLGDDSLIPVAVTAVLQPTPETAGKELAEMTLAKLRKDPTTTMQRLFQPVLFQGASDGPPPT